MPPGQKMEVDVKYRLTSAGIIVVDDAKPVCCNPLLTGNGCRYAKDMADQRVIIRLQIQRIHNMFFRHDKEVKRRDRRNILDGYDQVILVNPRDGNITPDYLAKDAVFHASPPIPVPSRTLMYLYSGAIQFSSNTAIFQ